MRLVGQTIRNEDFVSLKKNQKKKPKCTIRKNTICCTYFQRFYGSQLVGNGATVKPSLTAQTILIRLKYA